VEAYLEIHLLNLKNEHPNSDLSIFSSYAYNDAKYLNGTAGTVNLAGKRLEEAPQYLSRSGINGTVKNISATFYYSSVGGLWSDANNTSASSKNPSVGYVPSYNVLDFALSYKFLDNYNIRFGIDNLANTKYYTRRTETLVYLGKGVLPGDGRSIYFTFGAKF
jgi:Fe(3+) dicitrate transport protein